MYPFSKNDENYTARKDLELIRGFLSKRLAILAWVALVLTIIGQVFGERYWIAELLTHFVPHAGITLLLASCIFPPEGLKITRLLFFFSALILLAWSLMPFPYFSSNLSKYQYPITIHYQNVNLTNSAPKKVMQQLYPNDILILLEANRQWKHYLEKTQKNKTYCGVWRDDPFSIHVYFDSKVAGCELLSLANYPAVKLTLTDERIIYVAHPPPLINEGLAQSRNQYLYELKQKMLTTSHVLVIGDLNLTAFSPLYREFVKQTTLKRAMANAYPTWLPFGLSIDQILYKNISPTPTIKPLAWKGSDHRGFKVRW